ncbi:hypothetical protein [Streptomyces himastatinicus]|uniref:hypothetical protein n=1 Tax=Streptomyces himastatinicus TaxID=998084 RepID=UPI001AD83347|nr:hypothetical protein [Streptomyces himastatinicus]
MTLTEPERRLHEAFATGAKVDVRDAATADEPEEDGSGWGPRRTVRAEVIRSLLLGGADTRPGETPVVHLVGARVTGRLKLVFSQACCVLRLEKCWFEEPPQLYGATLHVTGFGGSYLPGLALSTVTVAGFQDLMETASRGKVNPDGPPVLEGSLVPSRARTCPTPAGVALDGSRKGGPEAASSAGRGSAPRAGYGCTRRGWGRRCGWRGRTSTTPPATPCAPRASRSAPVSTAARASAPRARSC